MLPKEKLENFFEKLKELGEVHAPVRRGSIFAFSRVESVEQIDLSCIRTMIPPKKYFIQTCEEIFKFTMGEGYFPAITKIEKIVLFGVHACDINAMKILDNVFLDEPADVFYEQRRKNTFVVGISCEPDDHCFCKSVGADSVQDNYDLFLYDLGDRYLVDAGSRRGEEFLLNLNLQDPTHADFAALRRMLAERDLKFRKTLNAQGLPQIVDSNPSSEVWGRYAEKCLACGSCNLVCPTCRCYSIDEFKDLSLKGGARTRRWDSCFLKSHALVAGGLNFRPTRLDRFRHRYNCKSSIEWKSGGLFCVGCGRCSVFCPAGIDHVEVLNNLVHLSVMTI